MDETDAGRTFDANLRKIGYPDKRGVTPESFRPPPIPPDVLHNEYLNTSDATKTRDNREADGRLRRDLERAIDDRAATRRAADPVALGAWYRDCLGLDADENGLWRREAGPTVFATFESETDYFRAQHVMINFRVRDLDAMLAQPRAKGADVVSETQDMEGVGRFGWVSGPEGNRVELSQPA